jgi:1-acyl-sn-glycerol-3-phosphate acyltransferase
MRRQDLRHPQTWLLRGGRPTARRALGRRYDIRVHGASHVPTSGPAIVAANHTGVLDGPLLAIFSPRPVHALTKVEMFHGKTGLALHAAGQVPLDRLHTDVRAIRICQRVLDDGGVVGIFPEGNRGAGDLSHLQGGAAYLALVSGAPIVPLMMFGTRPAGGGKNATPLTGGVIDLVYGVPFTVDRQPWPRTPELVAAVTESLRERMLADLDAGLHLTGQTLPGPIPADSAEEIS